VRDIQLTQLSPYLWPTVALVATGIVALALRAVLLASVRRWPTSGPPTGVMTSLRGPSLVWCAIAAVYAGNEVALDTSVASARWHGRVTTVLVVAAVISVTMVLASVAAEAIAHLSERSALGVGVTGLAQTTSRATVFAVGLLVLLAALGVQIAPLLTALGVGGLAVALALQDTLANLFSGIHLLADRPIRVGDYIKLPDAGEGFVIDIGWRSTRMRTLGNAVLIAPNQTVAKATITNYSLPDDKLSLGLRVSVDNSVDPDRVQAILLDEARRAVGQVPGLLEEPAPSVSLSPGFGESSLDWSVGYAVATYVDQFQVQHELRRRIVQRFHAEGLPLAVPVRSVRVNGSAPDDGSVPDQREAPKASAFPPANTSRGRS